MIMEAVKQRLESFGYKATPEDDWPLQFVIRKVEQDIQSFCNLKTIPACLVGVAVDMAVGEFLLGKKASPGGLVGFDLDQAAKSISLGDATVTFGDSGMTPEQRLDALIARLLVQREKLIPFRRIKW